MNRRIRLYELYPAGGPSGLSTRMVGYFVDVSYRVAARSVRQAYWLVSHREWATGPEDPVGIVDHYTRGVHLLWDGCRSHGDLGLRPGSSKTAVVAAMRRHIAEAHGSEAEAQPSGDDDGSADTVVPADARCDACHRRDVELWMAPNGFVYCLDLIGCHFIVRRRLGLPLHVCEAARGRDYELRAAEYERKAAHSRERAATIMAWIPGEQSAEYRAYLASPEWRRFRDRMLGEANYRCADCGLRVADAEVHHLHYRTLGREQPGDVIVLCPACHSEWDDARREAARR